MVSRRLSREAGHRRKFLAIIDDTPECERAVAYASRRAKNTGGVLVLLYVIEPGDFQHWLGVEKIMRDEANATAATALDAYAEQGAAIARHRAGAGHPRRQAGRGDPQADRGRPGHRDPGARRRRAKEGPGPLVASIAGKGAAFPIPVTVVPQNLSDEEIDSLA